MAPAPARGELRRTLAQMRESLLWEPTTKTESAARSATATAVNSSREGRRRSRDHCPRRRRTHDHGRTRSRIAMGELKLEKKGDAELEKVLAEIDALKTEATEVRVVRKSLSSPSACASPPPFPCDDDDVADLDRPRSLRVCSTAGWQTRCRHREDARAGEDLPPGPSPRRRRPRSRVRSRPPVDLLQASAPS